MFLRRRKEMVIVPLLLALVMGSFAAGAARAAQEPKKAAQTPKATAEATPARVRLHVAMDAQVWFNGKRTASGGDWRTFVTPPLTPGRSYSYDVRIRWMEGRQTFERDRHVTVRAGQSVLVDVAPSTRPRVVSPPRFGVVPTILQDPAAPQPWRDDYNPLWMPRWGSWRY